MIVCGACGHENPGGTEFCTNCGRFLEWTQRAEPTEPVSRPPQPPKPPEPGPTTLRDPIVTVDPPSGAVAPGDSIVLTGRVRNVSTIVDSFALTVAGVSAAWWKVTPTTVKLYPDTEGEVRLEFRPPRGPDLVAGQVPVALNARSDGPNVRASTAVFNVEVSPVPDASAEISPRTSRAVRTGRHAVRITNRGNAPWRASARAVDPDERLRIASTPEIVEVAPGSTGVVSIAARAPSLNIYGRPDGTPFNVELRPTDGGSPIRLDGRFEQRSLITGLPLALAGGLLAVAIVAIGVLAGWIPPKPGPTTPVESNPAQESAVASASVGVESIAPGSAPVVTSPPTPPPTPAAEVDPLARQIAAERGFGDPVGVTVPTEDGVGRYQAFDQGVIYLRPDGRPVPMFGSILGAWRCRLADQSGIDCPADRTGPLPELGYPTDIEQSAGGPPFQLFDIGGIYCNTDNNCYVVGDPIHQRLLGLRSDGYNIGLPIRNVIASDELTSGGYRGKFDYGFIITNGGGDEWLACSYDGTIFGSNINLTDCSAFAASVRANP